MTRFAEWHEKCVQNLVDISGPLSGGPLVTPSAPGVMPPSWATADGYMIVPAKSTYEATGIAGACAGLVSSGPRVEVIEVESRG